MSDGSEARVLEQKIRQQEVLIQEKEDELKKLKFEISDLKADKKRWENDLKSIRAARMGNKSTVVFGRQRHGQPDQPRATQVGQWNAFSRIQGSLAVQPKPPMTKYYWDDEVDRCLKRLRLREFRPRQREAINYTLNGRDVFIIMPTGGGKSLCYQLPAILDLPEHRGLTVVVSPLVSLIQDQVQIMDNLDISVAELTAGSNDRMIYERAHNLKLLFITPEKLHKSVKLQEKLTELYSHNILKRFVIDEAHCCSQWGNDFRPDYKKLSSLRNQFPRLPIMALTATATHECQADVCKILRMRNPAVVKTSSNRPNLKYIVVHKTDEKSTVRRIKNMVMNLFTDEDGDPCAGIIYCFTRKECETLYKELNKVGISVFCYHAGLDIEKRRNTLELWLGGQLQIIVSTISFGMGVDKPDVRFVIHHTIPKSMSGLAQETGRAGRDGKFSNCTIFYRPGDAIKLAKFVARNKNGKIARDEVLEVAKWCQQNVCRRKALAKYFKEHITCRSNPDNELCDVCLGAPSNSKKLPTALDFRKEGRALVDTLKTMKPSTTLKQLATRARKKPQLSKRTTNQLEYMVMQLIIEKVCLINYKCRRIPRRGMQMQAYLKPKVNANSILSSYGYPLVLPHTKDQPQKFQSCTAASIGVQPAAIKPDKQKKKRAAPALKRSRGVEMVRAANAGKKKKRKILHPKVFIRKEVQAKESSRIEMESSDVPFRSRLSSPVFDLPRTVPPAGPPTALGAFGRKLKDWSRSLREHERDILSDELVVKIETIKNANADRFFEKPRFFLEAYIDNNQHPIDLILKKLEDWLSSFRSGSPTAPVVAPKSNQQPRRESDLPQNVQDWPGLNPEPISRKKKKPANNFLRWPRNPNSDTSDLLAMYSKKPANRSSVLQTSTSAIRNIECSKNPLGPFSRPKVFGTSVQKKNPFGRGRGGISVINNSKALKPSLIPNNNYFGKNIVFGRGSKLKNNNEELKNFSLEQPQGVDENVAEESFIPNHPEHLSVDKENKPKDIFNRSTSYNQAKVEEFQMDEDLGIDEDVANQMWFSDGEEPEPLSIVSKNKQVVSAQISPMKDECSTAEPAGLHPLLESSPKKEGLLQQTSEAEEELEDEISFMERMKNVVEKSQDPSSEESDAELLKDSNQNLHNPEQRIHISEEKYPERPDDKLLDDGSENVDILSESSDEEKLPNVGFGLIKKQCYIGAVDNHGVYNNATNILAEYPERQSSIKVKKLDPVWIPPVIKSISQKKPLTVNKSNLGIPQLETQFEDHRCLPRTLLASQDVIDSDEDLQLSQRWGLSNINSQTKKRTTKVVRKLKQSTLSFHK